MFDRSWYNRARGRAGDGVLHPRGVPGVHGGRHQSSSGCSCTQGCHLTKFWFLGDQGRAAKPGSSIRQVDPVRQWKLSPMDIKSLDKWDEYTEAKEAMFFYTDTARRAVDGGEVQRQEARPGLRPSGHVLEQFRLRRQGRGRLSASRTGRSSGRRRCSQRRRRSSRSPDCEAALHVTRDHRAPWARSPRSPQRPSCTRRSAGTPPGGPRPRSGRRCTRCRSSGCGRRRFCVLATSDADGNCDASPKGDPAGQLIHVLDPRTIVIAERPGNKRADGLRETCCPTRTSASSR